MPITIVRMVAVAVMSAVVTTVASGQARQAQGPTDEQIAAMVAQAKADPNNPEAHYRLAVVYWNKACVPRARVCEAFAGPPDMQATHVQSGLIEVDKALALRADYIDALAYKNLLLRSKAFLEPSRADVLIEEADALLETIGRIQSKASGR